MYMYKCMLIKSHLSVSFYFSVLHVIKFSDFYIEWNSPTDIFMFSDSASSRLFRAVGSKLGVQKCEYVHTCINEL